MLLAAPFVYRGIQWSWPHNRAVDQQQAAVGKDLFLHEWTPNDPLSAGGDGLGPVFNARSCVACHNQGGTGGSGASRHNVTMFVVAAQEGASAGAKPRAGLVHTQAINASFQESFGHVHSQLPQHLPVFGGDSAIPLSQLNDISRPSGGFFSGPNFTLTQRKTPALFGARLIDEIPERDIIANARLQRLKWGLASSDSKDLPIGRILRGPDGRVGRFGWKGQTVSLAMFVQGACANELGLGNPGQAQPVPLGKPDYRAKGNDLTAEQCAQITEFICSLSQPVERLPAQPELRQHAVAGKKLFSAVGCADCHTPQIGSIAGIYSDLLLHDMGPDLEAGGGYYNEPPPDDPSASPGSSARSSEWRTPPLWGVARSAPYLHDGRAPTLEAAIEKHRGQAKRSSDRFAGLIPAEKQQLIAFLQTLDTP